MRSIVRADGVSTGTIGVALRGSVPVDYHAPPLVRESHCLTGDHTAADALLATLAATMAAASDFGTLAESLCQCLERLL